MTNLPLGIPRFVFLAVESGSEHRLAQLDVYGLDDDCFFRLLREDYLALRGYLRRWLSIWKYSHCNFVTVYPFLYLGAYCY